MANTETHKVPATNGRKPATLAELQRSRELVAVAPSGLAYKIRPINLERHALAGDLPAQLRQLALGGSDELNKVFDSEEDTSLIRDYLDSLVRGMVLEPKIGEKDLDILPPPDYRWLVSVAMGDEDHDGEGRRLWGREPLSSFRLFREFHSCPEDCAGCAGVVDAFSAHQ